MRSMTGFGRASGEDQEKGIGFRVEISSINRKQFETKFALPREISVYESKLRMLVADRISRGSVTFRADFLSSASPESRYSINETAAEKIIAEAHLLAQKNGLKDELRLADVLRVLGVVQIEPVDFSESDIEELLCKVTNAALTRLIESRASEGVQLEQDIRLRISILKHTLAKIEPLVAKIPRQLYERLIAKLQEYNLPAGREDERMLRELLVFADKSDVTEEITRLHSHFIHFDSLLDTRSDAIGRQLDFMVQETFREINTLGNKAACADVSPLIVIMKTELEKIREQIQNIE